MRIHRGVEKLPVDGHLKLVSEKGVTHHRITTATHSASFNESMADAAGAASQNVFIKDGSQRGNRPFFKHALETASYTPSPLASQ